jgi:hypothetical protein
VILLGIYIGLAIITAAVFIKWKPNKIPWDWFTILVMLALGVLWPLAWILVIRNTIRYYRIEKEKKNVDIDSLSDFSNT